MGPINYHHLLYFWTTAREGSVSVAARTLYVSQSTVSEQIHQLEQSMGGALFTREGRKLALTSFGKEVLRYADDIFSIGRELEDMIADRPSHSPFRVQIGVIDRLPKMVAYQLIEPAIKLDPPMRFECHDGPADELIARLVDHELDVVLSDAPAQGSFQGKIYHHLLGTCGVSFLATRSLAMNRRRTFPQSLDKAPLLLPTKTSPLRKEFDQWCDSLGLQVEVKAEFDDSALMKAFGQQGVGIFPVPSAVEKDICKQYHVTRVGRTDQLTERFFAISVERRIRHPAVQAITERARDTIFATGRSGSR